MLVTVAEAEDGDEATLTNTATVPKIPSTLVINGQIAARIVDQTVIIMAVGGDGAALNPTLQITLISNRAIITPLHSNSTAVDMAGEEPEREGEVTAHMAGVVMAIQRLVGLREVAHQEADHRHRRTTGDMTLVVVTVAVITAEVTMAVAGGIAVILVAHQEGGNLRHMGKLQIAVVMTGTETLQAVVGMVDSRIMVDTVKHLRRLPKMPILTTEVVEADTLTIADVDGRVDFI